MAVKVLSGANEQEISAASGEEFTVGKIREELGAVLNIDPNSIAVIGDREVTDDEIVPDGTTLQFIKRSGSKG